MCICLQETFSRIILFGSSSRISSWRSFFPSRPSSSWSSSTRGSSTFRGIIISLPRATCPACNPAAASWPSFREDISGVAQEGTPISGLLVIWTFGHPDFWPSASGLLDLQITGLKTSGHPDFWTFGFWPSRLLAGHLYFFIFSLFCIELCPNVLIWTFSDYYLVGYTNLKFLTSSLIIIMRSLGEMAPGPRWPARRKSRAYARPHLCGIRGSYKYSILLSPLSAHSKVF